MSETIPEYASDPDDTQELTPVAFDEDDTSSRRADVLPIDVVDPDGELLGASTVVVRYDVPHEQADEQLAQILEIGQFSTKEDATQFGQELLNFYHYAYPGDLPSLAEDVAKRTGLPATWRSVEDQELADIQRGEYVLTHEHDDWHPREYTPDPNYGPDTDLDL